MAAGGDRLKQEGCAMDFALSEMQQSLHDETLTLAGSFSMDYWLEKDRSAEYPWEFVNAFAERGWLGTIVPERYGGAGLGITEAALLLHAVCLSGAGTSGASAIHFYMFPPAPVIRYGSEEMKRRYLPSIARGEILTAFGVTEPSAGSDTSRITTWAERQQQGNQRTEGLDHQRSECQEDPAAHTHLAPRRGGSTGGDDPLLHRSRPQCLHHP